MSGADSTTEVTPTGRYEDHSLSIGGVKMSGLGRENGQEGFAEYLETKSAVIRI